MQEEERAALAKALGTARMVTGTLLGSLVLYAAVVQFTWANGPELEPASNLDFFRYLFYGLAATTVLAVRIARIFLLGKGPGRPPAQRLLQTQVVTAAMIEAPGIYGLLLFILARSVLDAYVLIGLSAFMMMAYFPRAAAWEEYTERVSREDGRT